MPREERTRICESSFQRTLRHRSQHPAVAGLYRRKNQHFRLKSLHPPAVCDELETTARPHVALQQELAVASNIFIRRHFQLIPFNRPRLKEQPRTRNKRTSFPCNPPMEQRVDARRKPLGRDPEPEHRDRRSNTRYWTKHCPVRHSKCSWFQLSIPAELPKSAHRSGGS